MSMRIGNEKDNEMELNNGRCTYHVAASAKSHAASVAEVAPNHKRRHNVNK
jgi:hypothetical protein